MARTPSDPLPFGPHGLDAFYDYYETIGGRALDPLSSPRRRSTAAPGGCDHLDPLYHFAALPPPPRRDPANPFPHAPDFYGFDEADDSAAPYHLGLGLGLGFQGSPEPSIWDGQPAFFSPLASPSAATLNAGFDADSDPDDHADAATVSCSSEPVADYFGPPQCWDCLRLVEEEERELNDDAEWEEVDNGDIFSMMVGVDDEGSIGRVDLEYEGWVASPSENDPDYEALLRQLTEHEFLLGGNPPTSKAVVENLPAIVLTEEDVASNDHLCPVCKDGISTEERARQLPCLHRYHGNCIVPWLEIRNTCPVCRYELPTDDPDYEGWRKRIVGGGAGSTLESPSRPLQP